MDKHGNGDRHDTLKILSEQFAKIGWDKKLQDLTRDEALAIIDAINSASGVNNGVLDLNPNTDIFDEDEIPF
jgi:hypothetical protein|tara:strand:+ start:222 stop:437 length:216 start_codon:yes stop_codon:yes gene_type:complete